MIFALTPHAQRHLGLQFERRQAKKVYLAHVWGEMAEKTGTVDLPLIVDWPNRPRQKVDHAEGRPAVTDWRVVRVEDGTTRVRLYPHTGRSHQLRVHMAEIGLPDPGRSVLRHGNRTGRATADAPFRKPSHPASRRRGGDELFGQGAILTAEGALPPSPAATPPGYLVRDEA
jgi:hypothetical protein